MNDRQTKPVTAEERYALAVQAEATWSHGVIKVRPSTICRLADDSAERELLEARVRTLRAELRESECERERLAAEVERLRSDEEFREMRAGREAACARVLELEADLEECAADYQKMAAKWWAANAEADDLRADRAALLGAVQTLEWRIGGGGRPDCVAVRPRYTEAMRARVRAMLERGEG